MSDPTPLRERIATALATAWGPQDTNSRDQTFGLLADAVLDAIGSMVPADRLEQVGQMELGRFGPVIRLGDPPTPSFDDGIPLYRLRPEREAGGVRAEPDEPNRTEGET